MCRVAGTKVPALIERRRVDDHRPRPVDSVAGTKVPALIERWSAWSKTSARCPGVAGTKVPALIERRTRPGPALCRQGVLPELKFRPSLSVRYQQVDAVAGVGVAGTKVPALIERAQRR